MNHEIDLPAAILWIMIHGFIILYLEQILQVLREVLQMLQDLLEAFK